jgi:putative phage-type endonuclease
MTLTQEQVRERLSYIGASDAAAVLGLSRWQTPLEIWAEKTGQVPPKDLSANLAVEVGTELEDLVAKLFTKRTGKKVRRVNETKFHKTHPFLACNLDRIVEGTDDLLECKTASGWKAKEWEGEEIPQEYVIQVMHQLMVTGRQVGWIACLIGGNADFRYKKIVRDDTAIKLMLEKEVHFWKTFVEPKVMPTLITKNDADILGELFPMGESEEPIELGDDANQKLDMLEGFEADLKALEGQIDQTKNEIRALLQDRQAGLTDRWKVTWKDVVSRRIDSTRMKKEAPELYADWSNVSKARTLRVSKLKQA